MYDVSKTGHNIMSVWSQAKGRISYPYKKNVCREVRANILFLHFSLIPNHPPVLQLSYLFPFLIILSPQDVFGFFRVTHGIAGKSSKNTSSPQ